MKSKIKIITSALVLATIVAVSGCASMGQGTIAEKREAILTMQDVALAKLYKEKPDVRAQIETAPGYAVFSNANVNVVRSI